MSLSQSKVRHLVILVSGLCYVAALPMPALLFSAHAPVRGITALLWGWWGVLSGDLPWFANPLYFLALGLLLFRFHKTAQVLSALALGLGIRSLYVPDWYFNEAGGTPIAALGLAFYFWMGSFVLLLIGSAVVQWTRRQTSDEGMPAPPMKLGGSVTPLQPPRCA